MKAGIISNKKTKEDRFDLLVDDTAPDVKNSNPLVGVNELIKSIKKLPSLKINTDFHFADEKGDFML